YVSRLNVGTKCLGVFFPFGHADQATRCILLVEVSALAEVQECPLCVSERCGYPGERSGLQEDVCMSAQLRCVDGHGDVVQAVEILALALQVPAHATQLIQ